MKKTVKCSIFLIFAAMFVLASFSPSVDGRAVVANRGELPEGLFAKSVGYLPGDTLSVTNMVTRQTASVLVVGALDASEGVAILLSPEAANVLGIAKNSNVVVKITKRPDELDKAFVGNAFVAKDDVANSLTDNYSDNKNVVAQAPVVTPAPAATQTPAPVTETKPAIEHTYIPVTTPEPVASVTSPAPTTQNNLSGASAVETLPREIKEVAKAPSSSNIVSQSPKTEGNLPKDSVVVLEEKEARSVVSEFLPVGKVDEKVSEPVKVTEPVKVAAQVTKQVEEKIPAPAPIIKTEKKLPMDSVVITEEKAPSRNITEEKKPIVVVSESIPAPHYDIPSEHVAITEEPSKNDISKEKFVAEIIPAKTEDSPVKKDTEPLYDTVPPAFEEPVKSSAVPKDIYEDAPAKSYVAVETSPMVEKSHAVGNETYAPIVLVPAEMNPPETAKTEYVENKPSKNISETVKPAGNLIASLPPTTSSSEYEKYIVKDLGSLKRGSYYVQVATMTDKSNMNNIVKNYGNNYPLAFVPASNGKLMQVMVGPLSVDEYEVVMTRFKSFGFNDLFLRKIK